jgi:hypothetical protein
MSPLVILAFPATLVLFIPTFVMVVGRKRFRIGIFLANLALGVAVAYSALASAAIATKPMLGIAGALIVWLLILRAVLDDQRQPAK